MQKWQDTSQLKMSYYNFFSIFSELSNSASAQLFKMIKVWSGTSLMLSVLAYVCVQSFFLFCLRSLKLRFRCSALTLLTLLCLVVVYISSKSKQVEVCTSSYSTTNVERKHIHGYFSAAQPENENIS